MDPGANAIAGTKSWPIVISQIGHTKFAERVISARTNIAANTPPILFCAKIESNAADIAMLNR